MLQIHFYLNLVFWDWIQSLVVLDLLRLELLINGWISVVYFITISTINTSQIDVYSSTVAIVVAVVTPVIFSVNETCSEPSLDEVKTKKKDIIFKKNWSFVRENANYYLARWKLATTLGASGKLVRVNCNPNDIHLIHQLISRAQ